MKLLVCGGRDFSNWYSLKEKLDLIKIQHPDISLVIHGAAPGADTLAESWAGTNSIKTQRFIAQWNTHGKSAGPIRNQQMLDEGKPDLVVAFYTGGSGTKHMISISQLAEIPTMVYRYNKYGELLSGPLEHPASFGQGVR